MSTVRVLGIETSCDETGVAVYDSDKGLLAHVLHSQITLHQQYGGVVPELASRDHVNYLVNLVDHCLHQAEIAKNNIDVIAYTAGPGLVGALLVGACFAKSLSTALNKPAIAVHHLEAHILAAQLDNPNLQYPFLVLLVSGGHTQLIEARGLGDYLILGDTLDDAVGEAFDKTAKLLGIPYPGGAVLAEYADNCLTDIRRSQPSFPRPMLDRPGLDFSFSGLKTHALQTWLQSSQDTNVMQGIAYAFQEAVLEVLVKKCQKALLQTEVNQLVVAGGVGANKSLRQRLLQMLDTIGGKVYFPRPEFCTDNGAMVAYAGYLHFRKNTFDQSLQIHVQPRWSLGVDSVHG